LAKIVKEYKTQIKAVGIGLPGPIDLKKGIILRTPHLPLKNTPIYSLLKKQIDLPLKIDNDVNCFTLAEALVGSGKNYRNVVGIALGTGIGGGIVINKKIYHGRNNAGEFGHQFINSHSAKYLESFLVVNNFKRSTKEYKNLEKSAQKNNKVAITFWDDLGKILGYAFLNIINILDPDIIILGGKQTNAFKYFSPSLFKTIKQGSFLPSTKIVKSKLIDKAGIIGAAMLFKQ